MSARERAPEGGANVFMGTIEPQEVPHGQCLLSHLSALSQRRVHRRHQRAAPGHARAIPTLSTPYPRDNGGYPRVSGASCPPHTGPPTGNARAWYTTGQSVMSSARPSNRSAPSKCVAASTSWRPWLSRAALARPVWPRPRQGTFTKRYRGRCRRTSGHRAGLPRGAASTLTSSVTGVTPYPRCLLTSQVSSASRSLAAVAFPPVIGRITVRPARS